MRNTLLFLIYGYSNIIVPYNQQKSYLTNKNVDKKERKGYNEAVIKNQQKGGDKNDGQYCI